MGLELWVRLCYIAPLGETPPLPATGIDTWTSPPRLTESGDHCMTHILPDVDDRAARLVRGFTTCTPFFLQNLTFGMGLRAWDVAKSLDMPNPLLFVFRGLR